MYFVNVGQNVKIAVEDLNPQGKETVFFIHGWPLGQRIFEYQTNVLPQLGFRVISMDLRGFGQSDTTASGYDYNTLASDVYKVINSMRIRDCTLVGFSMGGAIAIRYMSLFGGHKVKKLALLGAAAPSFTQRPGYPYGMTRDAVDQLIAQTYTDRPQMALDFGSMLFASNPSESLRQWFTDISWDASGLGTIETAISLRDEDLREDLKSIKVPTGIFHGKLDKICPYVFADLMHQGIQDSKIYPFEHSGHAVFYDELEKFNQEFINFLQNGL